MQSSFIRKKETEKYKNEIIKKDIINSEWLEGHVMQLLGCCAAVAKVLQMVYSVWLQYLVTEALWVVV